MRGTLDANGHWVFDEARPPAPLGLPGPVQDLADRVAVLESAVEEQGRLIKELQETVRLLRLTSLLGGTS